MTDYNLLENQRHLLGLMVQAVEKGCRPAFAICANSMFRGVVFDGDNRLHEQIECETADLQALNVEGLITLVNRGSGALTQFGIDAVRCNFVRPHRPDGVAAIYVQGNVANIQSGSGNIATVRQDVGIDVTEALAMIQECRGLIGSLNEAGQQQTKDALDDLEAEIKNGSPKGSRIRAYFRSASEYVAAGTALFISLKKLAGALGLDPASIAAILHRLP